MRHCGISSFLGCIVAITHLCASVACAEAPAKIPEVHEFDRAGGVEASADGQRAVVTLGQKIGPWTLMALIADLKGRRVAVFEDLERLDGRMAYISRQGEEAALPKTCEPAAGAPPNVYRGHTLEEVLASEEDLLSKEILAQGGDPEYDAVAACLPPIAKMYTATFVGTDLTAEKVGFEPGGRSPNFDPAVYIPSIEKVRAAGRVHTGLVGGWLPALRFIYPEGPDTWSEMVAFAPPRLENSNDRVQPVWYRVLRVEEGKLRFARYFDSYHPFPPRMEPPPERFYEDLLRLRAHWEAVLGPAPMRIDVPDRRWADMSLHSLVRERMTRVLGFPKYGVFDRSYGSSEHDGFPDTFTTAVTALLAWGLQDAAAASLDTYFTSFVRDDGSILYRGPETGQFGRMLTVAAEYADLGGREDLLLKVRSRLDGVARLLLALREKSLALPHDHPAHGMIEGWCEADACIDPEPSRYMQPYFSNTTEAWRGFRDLGATWVRIGERRKDAALAAWGRELLDASRAIEKDLRASLERSVLRGAEGPYLPAIAGAREPFHIAVARDRLDPQFRSYRANMEMLFSGCLDREQVGMIVRYRRDHKDTILGVPTAYGYGTGELAGFLAYGHAFGLLQHDFIREYLLVLYGVAAHHYTRGTWTAPETRLIDPKRYAAPYCVPAHLVVPLLVRWMLVFEDPASGALWLARATPRTWLEHGKRIAVRGAPTRRGKIGFEVFSHIDEGFVEATVDLPAYAAAPGQLPFRAGPIKLRLRLPRDLRLQSATVDGKPWKDFDPAEESVTLPEGAKGRIVVRAQVAR